MRWTARGLVVAIACAGLQGGCSDDSGQTPETDSNASKVTEAVTTGTTGETTDPTTSGTTEPPEPLLCGNGALDPDETCDDGNLDNSDGCLNSCKLATCGDGFVQTGSEQCDDGNGDNSDTCTALCETARCGDGFVQLGAEECDDGNAQEDDGCTSACVVDTAMLCGNGNLDPGEMCDDGNMANDDSCVGACVPYACGDGFTHAVFEECDDANADFDDTCIDCLNAYCGDGYIQTGVEECDDGNPDNSDDCLATCALATCGDGILHAGDEVCDDGVNDGSYDGCAPDCAKLGPTCGDGTLDVDFETCDDGNLVSLDGCDDKCQAELPLECLNAITFAEADRNWEFNDGPGKVTKCDKVLGGKWYRFGAPAGVMLSPIAPKPYSCGTDAPGWINGTHPTVDEGVVDRQVCFVWDSECDWETLVQVRNCGDYFVYKLADPPEECLRYCAYAP